MLKGLLPVLAMLLVGNVVATANQRTVEEFQRLADELPFLSAESVVYDRPYRAAVSFVVGDDTAADQANQHNRILAQLGKRSESVEQLRTLLSHDSPQVRTLAAIALFNLEDASLLPDLLPLANDHALTFPREPPLVCAPVVTKTKPKPRPQTVAEVVAQMFSFYMNPAGYHCGLVHQTQPGFSAYWEERKDRSFCATWFEVRLRRASGNIQTVPKHRNLRRQRLRDEIDALPEDDRTWTLLWLHEEPGDERLVPEAALVRMCRQLGREKLFSLLNYTIDSDDPDLQSRRSNETGYHRMVRFVLRHADKLLAEQDAGELLRCEQWQRDYLRQGRGNPLISPLWPIAAAQLQPSNASTILKEAMFRFDREYDEDARSSICRAMWQLVGDTESDYIVDWFYDEYPDGATFPHAHAKFIRSLGTSPTDQALVSKIVRDDRFEVLDWQTIDAVVRWANQVAATPVVTSDDLKSARHPLGMSHFHWQQEKAEADFPEETKQLRMTLNRWREALRRHLRD